MTPKETQHVLGTALLTSRESLYLKVPEEAPLHSLGLIMIQNQRKEVETVRNTEDCFVS